MMSQRDAADASRDLRFFVRTATPRPCGTAAFADARLPTLFFCIIPNPIEKVKQNYAIFKSKGVVSKLFERCKGLLIRQSEFAFSSRRLY
ncbi:MAG: hypothetical protein IJP98_01730 [Clostridia bacterium]|nr:hypothetical protein [Clostridia bacterium]